MVNDAVLELHSMEKEIPWDTCGMDEVFTAESAEQAREILQREAIDLLLCDIEMPGEDGISLIRWIRKEKLDVDCILLTCHADFAYAKEAVFLDCKEYIVLPALYEDIAATVRRVAGERAQHMDERKLQEYGRNWVASQQEKLKDQTPHTLSPKETVAQCEAYIQEHLGDEDLNVNDIGASFFMNPIYLSRIFKKEKGMPINQWIIKMRMELAAQLLKDHSLTAVAVAEHCGYTNYPYFSTVFKKYYGCTPSQYLEQQ